MGKTGTSDDDDAVAALREDLARLREEVAGWRGSLAGGAGEPKGDEGSESLKHKAERRFGEIEHEIEHLAAMLRGGSRARFHEIETQVAARPLTALAVAFGIGALTGQLLRR